MDEEERKMARCKMDWEENEKGQDVKVEKSQLMVGLSMSAMKLHMARIREEANPQ
jgi:hypothetical protein